MKLAIAGLLLLHGALHLLGFLKPFGLARLDGMTGRALVPLSAAGAQAIGLAWLAAAVVLIGAGVLRLFDARAWWWAAAGGLLLSQALIVLMWHDARAGTLANVLLAVAVAAAAGQWSFERRVQGEAAELLTNVSPPATEPVRLAELAGLPPPVQRWLEAAGVVGRPRVRTVRLRQSGQMRLKRDGAWMQVRAEQYFDVGAASFLWSVKTKLFDAVPLVGRDRLAQGRGHMLIEVLGLFPVADARGPEIDQGTQLRYLAEIVWFPSAALEPYIRWEPIDDRRARATLVAGGTTASADFAFDAQGRFESLTAQRWYSPPGGAPSLETWVIPARAWKRFGGVEVPSQGDAVWKLKEGDLDYFRWRIERLEYDAPKTFAEQPAPEPPGAQPAPPPGALPGALPGT